MDGQSISDGDKSSKGSRGEELKVLRVCQRCLTLTHTHAQVVLTSKKCINKGSTYRMMKEWLNEGLLTSTGNQTNYDSAQKEALRHIEISGKKWYGRRKILTPAFHFKILEQFISVFDKHSDILVSKLHPFKSTDKVDLSNFVAMFALDVICGKDIIEIRICYTLSFNVILNLRNLNGNLRRCSKQWSISLCDCLKKVYIPSVFTI